MSSGQGMANLDDLLGSTTVAPKKDGFSWADAPVEAPVEEKPVAKKAAWGTVQPAAPAKSFKEVEEEESARAAKGKDAPRAPPKSSSPYTPSGYSSQDRPSGDGPARGERWGANIKTEGGAVRGGDRERPSGGDWESRQSDRPRYNPDAPSHGGRRYESGDRPEGGRGERREHTEVPFPTQAPYMLYLTGLPWEGTEQEVRDLLPEFWGDELEAKVKNVKVPIKDGRLRHAFIEFEDADALRAALGNTGREFMGRNVTCLVAEPHTRSNDKFGSGFGGGDRERRSGYGGGQDRPRYNPDVPYRPERRERTSDYDGPSERKPLSLAPRTVTASSDAASGESKPKSNPFGSATASTRDIYADKPKVAPAPAATSASSAAPRTSGGGDRDSRRSEQPREESRADTRDWKAKEFKPNAAYRSATNGKPQGERRGGDRPQGGRGRNDDGGDWKSAGGKAPASTSQRKPAAPAAASSTTTSASADKGNIFDALSDA